MHIGKFLYLVFKDRRESAAVGRIYYYDMTVITLNNIMFDDEVPCVGRGNIILYYYTRRYPYIRKISLACIEFKARVI